ncbi:polyprenol monophosphomannose synthase [Frigoribacterium faeni]|uniref:polyprenol monophosphomannose synthase n=1 Tax=Frigoribacterium TaxID=96492 RepID=UPI001FAB68BE|nr:MULTISPECIES: polyprenol monophosphomannose synthase [Frigoribacterium]MCJ0699833.1 polyprenol monophosphomannose synthase [Frigoribacterium faeni]MDY0891160.1 polyprenol monophosphomannose synthase [Frigoribacterium sp. CFBP9030]
MTAADGTGAAPSVLVIIPTYDEAENIGRAVAKLREAVPAAHILIADDASPDGTGDIADGIAASDGNVHVLHRRSKDGLGAAYIEAFGWGMARGYDVLVEFDADGSHPAETLPEMLDALRRLPAPGLVIGSRWIKGGSVVNWPLRRELLSRGGNLYSRIALGIRVHDATAGFRAYSTPVLAGMRLEEVESRGYFFQVDMTLRTIDAGHPIAEVPIVFREREAGVSKMNGDIVTEAMAKVTRWGAARWWRRLTRRPLRR